MCLSTHILLAKMGWGRNR